MAGLFPSRISIPGINVRRTSVSSARMTTVQQAGVSRRRKCRRHSPARTSNAKSSRKTHYGLAQPMLRRSARRRESRFICTPTPSTSMLARAAPKVKELAVKTLSGNDFTVRARIYILAVGGIENARLLLASGKEGGKGLGNTHDLVGRFLMVHLVYPGGIIIPSHPRMTFDFRTHLDYMIAGGKHWFWSFISLSADSMRRRHLPNIMINWGYDFSPVKEAADALKRLGQLERSGGSWSADLSQVVRNFEGLAEFGVRKELFGEGVPIESLRVHCASEQQPNPQSKVSLGPKRDRLGMREVVVDWQLVPEDKSKAAETSNCWRWRLGAPDLGGSVPC